MRHHLMYLLLFVLLLALLLLAHTHPWPAWRWPARIFCAVTLFWLVPDVARALAWLCKLIKGRGRIRPEPPRPSEDEIYEGEARRRNEHK